MSRIVDDGTDGKGVHGVGVIRLKDGGEEDGVVELGIKPGGIGGFRQDHWHAIMNGHHQRVEMNHDQTTGIVDPIHWTENL